VELFGKWKLCGKHYVANIAVDEKTQSGLQVVSRDPRVWRHPPDAYVAKIEAVGRGCELVKEGDTATIERWRYLQLDLDDERIVGDEDQILLVNGKPVNGVAVMMRIDDNSKPETGLVLPDTSIEKAKRNLHYYHGSVMATSIDDMAVGVEIWIKKAERDQWKLGQDKIVFRWDGPEKNQYSNIMMKKTGDCVIPFGDRILVKPVEAGRERGGIIIPDIVKEKPLEGEVAAVGRGLERDGGKIRPMLVSKGDRVLYSKYSGTDIRFSGDDYVVIHQDDIFGIIETQEAVGT